ncbi:MAG: ENTH domain-containing protein [Olpidium bornovanus]|uniref:ENTH domain-containing protein n=1 Tax=Olpidium bornovanus TaxID=278681 RepID=A0A8H8DLA3_9FUNG|nr:MAG: ENTH domain-containing protein [Olpidium bornovanus]
MQMLDKRLNDSGKNWRHVFKVSALTLLDYCLHTGSENVVAYARKNLYIVKTLREFQFIDEDGRDQGANGTSALTGLRTETRGGGAAGRES